MTFPGRQNSTISSTENTRGGGHTQGRETSNTTHPSCVKPAAAHLAAGTITPEQSTQEENKHRNKLAARKTTNTPQTQAAVGQTESRRVTRPKTYRTEQHKLAAGIERPIEQQRRTGDSQQENTGTEEHESRGAEENRRTGEHGRVRAAEQERVRCEQPSKRQIPNTEYRIPNTGFTHAPPARWENFAGRAKFILVCGKPPPSLFGW